MRELLEILYAARHRGMSAPEVHAAFIARDPRSETLTTNDVARALSDTVRSRRVALAQGTPEVRVAHPAFPPMTHLPGGAIGFATPGEHIRAALAERLDREYASLTTLSAGCHGLILTSGTPRAQPGPPRPHHAIAHVLTSLTSTNSTFRMLQDAIREYEQRAREMQRAPEGQPFTTAGEIHEALGVLERTGLIRATRVGMDLVFHDTFLHPRLRRGQSEARLAQEGEPALAGTTPLYYLENADNDPDMPDVREFTLRELADALRWANQSTDAWLPLTRLIAWGLANAGYLRLQQDAEGDHARDRVHPEFIQHLKTPLWTPPRSVPATYPDAVREQAFRALRIPDTQDAPSLVGETLVDTLTRHVRAGTQDLVVLTPTLQNEPGTHQAATRAVQDAIATGSTRSDLERVTAFVLTHAPITTHAAQAAFMDLPPKRVQELLEEAARTADVQQRDTRAGIRWVRNHRHDHRLRKHQQQTDRPVGTPLTDEEREHLLDSLREMIDEDEVPSRSELAERFGVSRPTIYRYLKHVQDERAADLN